MININKNIIYSSSFIILACFLGVCNDAVINYLSPKGIEFYHFVFYGTPIYLLIPIYYLLIGKLKKNLQCTNYFIPILRSIIFVPMPILSFIVLRNISLPEFTTLNMTTPIFGIIISILFLKEKINKFIIFSFLFGIIGVLLVIRPGFDSYSHYYLPVLITAFLLALNGMLVNKYNNVASNIGFFIYGGIFTHLISIIFFLFDPIFIDFFTFLLITISSIFVNIAIILWFLACQKSINFFGSLNSLIYVQILFSMILGIIFFNEKLTLIPLIGAFFIIISGLISIPAQIKQQVN